LGLGMSGGEVNRSALLPSKFSLAYKANASLANFNAFTEKYYT